MGTSSEHPTETLSAQLKTKMNSSKKKVKESNSKRKAVLKTYLDNPFKLDWPPLEFDHYSRICKLIEESFQGFNWNEFTPPRYSYLHLRKNERKEYIEDQRQKMFENDPDKLEKFNLRSHFVIGFNAIMRQLERREISCIFINIESQSNIAERMFIPLCSTQSIPLVPLKCLSDILHDETTLGIKRCRALGLTKFATNKESPFWDLYSLSCLALGIDPDSQVGSRLVSMSESKASVEPKPLIKVDATLLEKRPVINDQQTLSKEEISALHLKRKCKQNRVFNPDSSLVSVKVESNTESFISFSTTSKMTKKVALAEISNKKLPSQNEDLFDASQASADMFILDTIPNDSYKFNEVIKSPDTKKRKLHYIPAAIKRVKTNPNKKNKKK